MLKRCLLISLLFSPVAAWAFYKPIRVFSPELISDITCVREEVCLDDVSRYEQASKLYRYSLRFVAKAVGPFRHNPRVIFCSTEKCFRFFGFKRASAMTVGKFGIVISPRGWSPYYLRHEMIHYRQSEELGTLTQWMAPKWLTEGMAYSLSEDPPHPLKQPWQADRAAFDTWYRKVDKEHLWEAASKL